MQYKDKRQANRERSQGSQGTEEYIRVRIPKGHEVLGILEQRLGASRMLVKCLDGVSRTCRIPGRLKRDLWLREGDVVLVEPWEFQKDRGDIIFKYSPAAVEWLKRKGFLKTTEKEF